MRENRLYGSEGGAGLPRSYPYHLAGRASPSGPALPGVSCVAGATFETDPSADRR